MKNWLMPAAVFVVGSFGAVLTSDRGRSLVRSVTDRLLDTHDQLLSWNEAAQAKLDRIQRMLDQLASTLTAR